MLITAELSTIAWARIFWCYKNFPNKNSAEISPEMNQKLTGNDIFRPQIDFWALEIRKSCQFQPISIKNAIIKCLGSTLSSRSVTVKNCSIFCDNNDGMLNWKKLCSQCRSLYTAREAIHTFVISRKQSHIKASKFISFKLFKTYPRYQWKSCLSHRLSRPWSLYTSNKRFAKRNWTSRSHHPEHGSNSVSRRRNTIFTRVSWWWSRNDVFRSYNTDKSHRRFESFES